MAKKSLFKRLGGLIRGVAPTVAGALGGPVGPIAATILRRALGADSDEEALAILERDPEAYERLQTAEMELKKWALQNKVELEKLHAEDRASARQLAIQSGKLPQIALSAIFVFGYFWLVWLLSNGEFKPIPEYENLTAGVVGVLTGGLTNILQFWFGSSSGSKDKTALADV